MQPPPPPPCDYPRENGIPCPRPAIWSTADIGETRHLCDECCADALRYDTFRATELFV